MKAIKLLLLTLFTILATEGFSQKHRWMEAYVKLDNGKEMEGLIKLPVKNSSTRIVFKESADAKKDAIKADEVDFFILNGKQGNAIIKRDKYYKRGGDKLTRQQSWLELRMYCDNFETYLGIAGFDNDKDGNLYNVYVDGMGAYLIKGEGEKHPTEVGYLFLQKIATQKMFDKQRKKMLEKYYARNKEALKWVKSKKRISIEELVTYLESNCETSNEEG